MVEVEISTVVNGDYPSVVRFINGLEHSDNFYVLDNLALARARREIEIEFAIAHVFPDLTMSQRTKLVLSPCSGWHSPLWSI